MLLCSRKRLGSDGSHICVTCVSLLVCVTELFAALHKGSEDLMAPTKGVGTQPDDVLIIGGGVIGLASALALVGAGRTVRVLEAGTVGCGASHGN
jgi:heterodisulfide reductase subunit A-like polyferredoxin